ncbi:MAG: hypothetical protein GTO02_07985, partial [Candidatus Dadabacteria bacterium]|nr:hypothetical protein [Candidatus Dadabacteria bacterium]
MSLFLASVTNLEEAKQVLAADADIIDLKNPAEGALGAVDYSVVTEVVNYVNNQCLVSATIGDLPMQAGLIENA